MSLVDDVQFCTVSAKFASRDKFVNEELQQSRLALELPVQVGAWPSPLLVLAANSCLVDEVIGKETVDKGAQQFEEDIVDQDDGIGDDGQEYVEWLR